MFKVNKYMNYDDEEYETAISGVTNWTEVTEKELGALWKWANKKNNDAYNDFILISVEQDVGDVKEAAVEDFKKMMARDAAAEKKRKIANDKRKATLAKKRADKKRAEYEKLKKEFEK
jgi:hypothetical protein